MKTILVAVNILLASTCLQASPAPRAVVPIVPVFRQPYGDGGGSRIVNGQEASVGQFPHQAAITLDGQAFCGGSLISDKWVLTAAHCISGVSSWQVTFGAHNLKDANENGRVVVASTKGTNHEHFGDGGFENDVGVISLPEEVATTDRIKPIKLAPVSYQGKNLAGTVARVSGWGKTQDGATGISPTLQFVDVPIISTEACAAILGSFITSKIYCTSGYGAKGTCSGDSGGALTIGNGSNVAQVGIVSFGVAGGCSEGYPSGYTAVPYQIDWITQKTGIQFEEEPTEM